MNKNDFNQLKKMTIANINFELSYVFAT